MGKIDFPISPKDTSIVISSVSRKVLWTLFVLMGACAVIPAVGRHFGLPAVVAAELMSRYMPVLFLLLYSGLTMGFLRAALFLVIAFTTAFIAEIVGFQYGALFGGRYVYADIGVSIWDMPLLVLVYWTGLIFIAYSVVSSGLLWSDYQKPARTSGGVVLVPMLAALDGVILSSIGLMVDPIAVKLGMWTWIGGGAFFGTPLGNFTGWIVVGTIATGIFRTIEYFSPSVPVPAADLLTTIPTFGYGLLCFGLMMKAFHLGMPALAIVGFFAMAPVFAFNFILFISAAKKVHKAIARG
jgi:uncharacterized membrane protein